jgi:hypothetical protein
MESGSLLPFFASKCRHGAAGGLQRVGNEANLESPPIDDTCIVCKRTGVCNSSSSEHKDHSNSHNPISNCNHSPIHYANDNTYTRNFL